MHCPSLKPLLLLPVLLVWMVSWAGSAAAPQQTSLPDVPSLVSGSAIDTRFDRTCYLTDRNGEALSFWAENLGTGDVVLTVNDRSPQRLRPGQVGQVTVPLSYFTKAYHCAAVPASEGELLHLRYCLIQGGEEP